jgi:N-acyl-D-amino-acid deacylase
MLDVCIRSATVVDGTGAPPYEADVGLLEDRIAAVGNLRDEPARVNVRAEGLVLAPGFIDMHSHSDESLLRDPRGLSKLLQGITTEVTGNCGLSPAPAAQASGNFLGSEAPLFPTMAQYLTDLESRRPAVNVAPLVGHGAVRHAVMGDEDRPATAQEMERQEALVREAMEAGAWGMSTGLIYPPGVYTPTEEIVALSRVMAPYGGVYFTHLRSEGDHLVEAVQEALTIGAKASVAVQLSHHKAAGRRNWGKTRQTLSLVEEARKRGQDVTLDVYPYTASATSLSALLPPWALAGGTAAALERLRSPEVRARIAREVDQVEAPDGYARTRMTGLRLPAYRRWEGRTIEEMAQALGQPPVEALLDLLLAEELRPGMIRFGMDEEDVERVLRYPWTMVGTDGTAISPDGPGPRAMVHPRTYGTFPRVLARYVRERGVLTLPEAIHRMTGLAALRLGLMDRGRVAPGAVADLVLFDPQAVRDTATFEDPHRFPEGIVGVWVGGQRAVDAGAFTGVQAGKVLRRPRAQSPQK